MTDAEIEDMPGEPLTVDADAWQAEVLRLVHRRSLPAMIEDGRLDAFDYLAIAPILTGDQLFAEHDEFERRRRRHLDELKIDFERIKREEAGHENHVRSTGRSRTKAPTPLRPSRKSCRHVQHERRQAARIAHCGGNDREEVK